MAQTSTVLGLPLLLLGWANDAGVLRLFPDPAPAPVGATKRAPAEDKAPAAHGAPATGTPAGTTPAPSSAASAAAAGKRLAPGFLSLVPPPAPAPNASEYQFRLAKDGSGDLVYDGPGFEGHIGPDGQASFRDRKLGILNPLQLLKPAASPRNVPTLQATLVGVLRDGRAPRAADSAANDDSTQLSPPLSRLRPDVREACRDCGFDDPLITLVAGRFDLTDMVMRHDHQDPYRAEKVRFLVATRELRTRRAREAMAANLRAADAALPNDLQRIACDRRLSRDERRAVIVALRAELDGTTAEGAAQARVIDAFIDDFVAKRLAPGSTDLEADARGECRPVTSSSPNEPGAPAPQR